MILVVDDDEGVRATCEHWLKGEGLDVRSVADGQAALDVLEQNEIGTFLVDIFMPGMEGIETIRRLRQDYPASRIIAMSGSRSIRADMLKAALALGADAALEKPFSLKQLLASIRNSAHECPAVPA